MRYATSWVLMAALCGVPFVAGCEKTLSEDKTVKENGDGGTKVTDKKVTEDSNGNVSKTTETKTVNPPDTH